MTDNLKLAIQSLMLIAGPLLAKHGFSADESDVETAAGAAITLWGIVWKFAHWHGTPDDPNGGTPKNIPITRVASILALAAALAFAPGCAHVTVTRDGFTALTPAWPWQDSTRVIDRLNVSSKTNSFTASVRGLNESETTSTNAVDLVRSMAEGLATGAVKAAKPTP